MPGRVFPLHYRVLNAACPLRGPCGAPVSIRPRTRGESGGRPRRPGLVSLRVRSCRNRSVIVNPVCENRLFRLLGPHVPMSAGQAAPTGIEAAAAPVEPRTARKGLTRGPRDGGGVQACLCTPTPAALAACGFARTVIGAFGDTGGLEPARTLSSCPAHTPCPLGGRSAPDRDGGPCAGCAPRLAGLVCPARR